LSNSIMHKRTGRITFLLSSVLVAVLAGAAAHLAQLHPDSRRVTLGLEYSLVLLGVFWLRLLERRLQDAGLPRWSFWPYFLFVFTVCFGAHAHKITDGPRTLALFIVLQIPAFLLQSQPAQGELLPGAAAQQAARNYPKYLKPVGPFLFLLRVLLIAAFSAAFLHLAQRTGRGVALWEMYFAVVILGLVWIYNVEGRALDAQLPSWTSALYCMIVPAASFLPILLNHFSLRIVLTLFVALQIPTLFLQSKFILPKLPLPEGKQVRLLESLGAFDFAVYIQLIAGLWAVLNLLRGDVGGGTWAWVFDVALDAGSLTLCLAWIVSVKGRLRNLGLARWYIDLCAIVLLLSLLPVSLRILSFTHALILFVVLQIPVVFLRKERLPARFLPAEIDS